MMMKIANFMKRLRNNEKGFTLIELMVVIAVLGIMAALIIPQFSNVNGKARLANAKSQASAIATAAAMVYGENPNTTVTATEVEKFMNNYSTAIAPNYEVSYDTPSAGKIRVTDKTDSAATVDVSYK